MADGKTNAISLVKKFLTAQLAKRLPETAASCLTSDVVWLGIADNRDVHNRREALAYFTQEAAASPAGYSLQFISENAVQIVPGCHTVTVKAVADRDGTSIRCVLSAVTKPEDGAEKIASLHLSVADAEQTASVEYSYWQAQQLRLYRLSQNAGAFRILVQGSFPLLYGNDRLYQLLGYESDELRKKLHDGCMDYVHPDDRQMVMEKIQAALASREKYAQWIMRIFTGAGELRYMQVVGNFRVTDEGSVMEGVEIDVTEQKLTELKLRTEQEKLNLALDNTPVYIWEYDPRTRTTVQQSKAIHDYGMPQLTENMPYFAVENGVVHPDSAQEFIEFYQKIDGGAALSEAKVRMYNKDGELRWIKMQLKSIFDATGKITGAIGIGIDITQQVEKTQEFSEFWNYRNAVLHNTIAAFRLNLTANWCGDGISENPDILKMNVDGTADGIFAYTYAHIPMAEELERYLTVFSRSRLLELFNEGKASCSMGCRYCLTGTKPQWIRTVVDMRRNPDTGDVMALLYAFNIDKEKTNEAIMSTVVNNDYDFIMLIDIRSNAFSLFRSNDDQVIVPPESGDDYLGMMQDVNRKGVAPQDVERAIHDMLPQTMQENLKNAHEFSSVYQALENDGSISYKTITYTWLSRDAGQIILTRTDITELMQNQLRQQDLLRNALIQAEQASNAKTDFLSKMSHEIRTPMNAIIGMNALAAQCLGDPKQAADCIAKVGISARFLLSLINDILDMSRIESGKLNIKSENIPFAEFLNGVNGIIYEQATECGLSYDSIITGFVAENYVGDAMKLQQILVNLLGNAVKFTPKGGKVQLIVTQERVERDKAFMKFTVNDTGVGISEEFQKVMFEPFEQEQTGIMTPYSGTGLGLAITKNLVQLMGGSIAVNSIVGVGTEFVVTIPLSVGANSLPHRISREIPLDKMSALVVDDEILICQQTQNLLADIGMKAEWVDSGHKAVSLVRARWEAKRYFDIILIDWKMPEMDGIETARQIRKIVGPDVTIIIITAYEWAEIEREAKAVGVNLLVSKPIFRSSLISTFEHIYVEKQLTQPAAAEPVTYDFTGKRALLTEDHLLNVEVAKRLLQAKGLQVEVAENGLAAIEAFTTHPDNYFDLILMDIRMPVMDGLTAARSIRQLKKPAAKTIPIIAMSANAFDDDIEKSRAAGMNAHLSKPIEPRLLYETLARFLQRAD